MADEMQPQKPAGRAVRLDATVPYDEPAPRDKTMPMAGPPGELPADRTQRLVAATVLLQRLAPQAPGAIAELPPDVRAVDFLRAADEIVRPFGFEIVRLIGKGGMGAVFEGRDSNLDRAVAVKFILPERLEMFEGMAALLESEARALASINHENAVQVYAIHRHGNNLFIVMEFVRGTSLAHYIAARGPLPEAQALRLSIQAARALAALHNQRIIHRDIKPENILLSETGQAKLSDFGLALARHGGKTASGILSSAAGTPAYMSPEVFEGETPSVRSDLYSLGMTLRFMLTGKRPPLGDSLDEIRRSVIHGRLPGLRTERPDVSAETELVVAMALKRSPDQRYQTAEALAAACEKAHLHLGAVREKPQLPPARVLLRRSGRAMAFICTIAVLAGVIGWWAHKVAVQGRKAFKMWSHTASDGALGLLEGKKKIDLVSAETALATSAGVTVRLIGAVSANPLFEPKRNQFVLQDETGGILIDDPNGEGQINASLAPGDKVVIAGTVRVWQGLRCVEPIEWIEHLGHSQPPKPAPLTLEQIGAAWSGRRVLVRDVQWAEQQPEDTARGRVSDGKGREVELRAGADSSLPANRSAKPFDLLAIVFATEPPGGKPGQVGEIFLVPLEIQEGKR